MEIIFTNTVDTELDVPKPANLFIPDWYKQSTSYITDVKKPNGKGNTTATIKKCVPVFDALTAGYIIELPTDVWVSLKDGDQYFEWPSLDTITFHPIEQAPLHPNRKPFAYPKFMNPWAIKTPKGYSTLIVQPFHRESVFTILPGIVDTDTYTAPINFPFVINDVTFEGVIPKGTPIAQLIPFKRDNWKKKLGSKKDLENAKHVTQQINRKFFERYKSSFWFKKEYR